MNGRFLRVGIAVALAAYTGTVPADEREWPEGEWLKTPEVIDLGEPFSAFSFVGDRRLAVAFRDGTVRFRSLDGVQAVPDSGQGVRLDTTYGYIREIAYSPRTGRLVVCGQAQEDRGWGSVGFVQAWDVKAGRRLWSKTLPRQDEGLAVCDRTGVVAVGVGLSPDATPVENDWVSRNIVVLLDGETGKTVRVLTGTATGVADSLAFSGDGRFLAVGGMLGRSVTIWAIESGKEDVLFDDNYDYRDHSSYGGVHGVAFLNGDTRLAAVCGNTAAENVWTNSGVLLQWDLRRRRLEFAWGEEEFSGASIVPFPDGRRFVTVSHKYWQFPKKEVAGRLTVWDTEPTVRVSRYETSALLSSPRFSLDGKILVAERSVPPPEGEGRRRSELLLWKPPAAEE